MALADHNNESKNVEMNVKEEQWSTWKHMKEKKKWHPLFCVQVRHVNQIMGSDPARGATVHTKKILNCLHQYCYIVAVKLPKLSSCRNRITPEQSQLIKKSATFAALTTALRNKLTQIQYNTIQYNTIRLTYTRRASRIVWNYSNIEATDFNTENYNFTNASSESPNTFTVFFSTDHTPLTVQTKQLRPNPFFLVMEIHRFSTTYLHQNSTLNTILSQPKTDTPY
jgi:hypothetical protein